MRKNKRHNGFKSRSSCFSQSEEGSLLRGGGREGRGLKSSLLLVGGLLRSKKYNALSQHSNKNTRVLKKQGHLLMIPFLKTIQTRKIMIKTTHLID